MKYHSRDLRLLANLLVHDLKLDVLFSFFCDRERFPRDDLLDMGQLIHKCINHVLTIFFDQTTEMLYISEPRVYRESKKGADGLLINLNNYLKHRLLDELNEIDLINELHLNPEEMTRFLVIQFDFTSDLSEENIIEKCEKYELHNSLLFIVGTRWYGFNETKEVSNNSRIKYPENVRIISHNILMELLGLRNHYKELIDNIIDKNYQWDIDSLQEFHSTHSIDLHNTEELKEFLINEGLIKENLEEMFEK